MLGVVEHPDCGSFEYICVARLCQAILILVYKPGNMVK